MGKKQGEVFYQDYKLHPKSQIENTDPSFSRSTIYGLMIDRKDLLNQQHKDISTIKNVASKMPMIDVDNPNIMYLPTDMYYPKWYRRNNFFPYRVLQRVSKDTCESTVKLMNDDLLPFVVCIAQSLLEGEFQQIYRSIFDDQHKHEF